MPSEITHKSPFRFGPLLWALVLVAIGGYILGVQGVGQPELPANPPCSSATSP